MEKAYRSSRFRTTSYSSPATTCMTRLYDAGTCAVSGAAPAQNSPSNTLSTTTTRQGASEEERGPGLEGA